MPGGSRFPLAGAISQTLDRKVGEMSDFFPIKLSKNDLPKKFLSLLPVKRFHTADTPQNDEKKIHTHPASNKNVLMVKNLTHLNNYAHQIRSFRLKAARFFFRTKQNRFKTPSPPQFFCENGTIAPCWGYFATNRGSYFASSSPRVSAYNLLYGCFQK